MTWYQSSSPLLYLKSMDIQIYWIRMDHPRIPTEAARSRGRTRGFVREQLLAFQLTHNSGVRDWESRASISPWWRAEKCWPCSPVSLLSLPMSPLESWGPVYPGCLGHGGETRFMRKSHALLQSFISFNFLFDLFNKANPRLLNTTLSNKLLIPNLAALFIFPVEFIIF